MRRSTSGEVAWLSTRQDGFDSRTSYWIGVVRKQAKRPRPPFGRCPNLGDLWVRISLVSLVDGSDRRVVFLMAACKAVAIKL